MPSLKRSPGNYRRTVSGLRKTKLGGYFTTYMPFTIACFADVAGSGQTVGPDGERTADDIVVFINWFTAGDLRADVAGAGQSAVPDGELTADDLIVFVNRLFRPC